MPGIDLINDEADANPRYDRLVRLAAMLATPGKWLLTTLIDEFGSLFCRHSERVASQAELQSADRNAADRSPTILSRA